MKCLLRAACAVLILAVASLGFCQSQIWSVFQNTHTAADLSSAKMVQAPDGTFYTLGTTPRPIFSTASTVVSHWSSTGELLWTRQFDAQPYDIAANDSYVVVTGITGFRPVGVVSFDERRAVLLRYDANGNSSQPVYLGLGFNTVAIGPNNDAFVTTNINSVAAYREYSPAGSLVRTVSYTGSGISQAERILVNSQSVTLIGNVGGDRFISQYSLTGQLNWVHFYDLNDTGGNRIFDTMDSSGAVYLLFIFETDFGSGAHVLKYDAAGNLIFDTFLQDFFASAIAVGPSGQVGISSDGFVAYQLTPQGTLQWKTPFSDQSTSSSSIAYDTNGNLYFAGRRNIGSPNYIGYVEKVSPTGAILWQNQNTGFGTFDGLALSSSGPVAFGNLGTTFLNGPALGLYRTDFSGNVLSTTQTENVYLNDLVSGAAVDANGNTYLVGAPGFVSKLDSNGLFKWTQQVGTAPYAVELNPAGGVVVEDAPVGVQNAVTVRRLSSTGTVMWQTTLSTLPAPANFFDRSEREIIPRHAMIEDAAGNTYVISRNALNSHVLVVKFDPSGNVLWTADWDSQDAHSSYLPEDIAVSPAGLVYGVVVRSNINGTNTVVLQINANTGAINWVLPSSPSLDGTEPIAVRTNNAGDAFVMGEHLFVNPGTAFVWKLDSSGNTVWKTTIPGMDQTPAMTDMKMDNGGDIFVTGSSVAASFAFNGINFRVVAAKLSPAGTPLWTTFWDDPNGDGTLPQRMTFDANGDLVIGGTTYNDQTGRDLFVLRLSGDQGKLLWPDSGDVFRNGAAIFDSGLGLQDYMAGIGVDTSNNIYVGGNSAGPEGLQDIHVLKYNAVVSRGTVDSQFVGQSVLNTMTAGQTYNVSVSFKNTGDTPWTKGTGFKLGSANPSLNNTWGFGTVALADGETINPGDTKVFKFSVHAPMDGGTYNFQWQMRNGNGAFGDKSTNVAVQVVKKAHAARFLSESIPTVVRAGQHFFVQVIFRNVGTNTWTAANGYSLMPVSGHETLGVSSVPVPGTILPGQDVTFTFVGTAPSVAGKYSVEWQMYRSASFWSGFFGDRTPIKTITVMP